MTKSSHNFLTYKPCHSCYKVADIESSKLTISRIGNIKIERLGILRKELYVPQLSKNLISIKKLMDNTGCNVLFTSDTCDI